MSLRATALQARRRGAGLLLAGLLLLAQSLGLLHGYSHGHGGASLPRAAAASPPDPQGHQPLAGAASALFDQHEDDSPECRLFDQLLHAEGLIAAAPALPAPAPAALPAQARPGNAPAAQAAGYLARGPPRA